MLMGPSYKALVFSLETQAQIVFCSKLALFPDSQALLPPPLLREEATGVRGQPGKHQAVYLP